MVGEILTLKISEIFTKKIRIHFRKFSEKDNSELIFKIHPTMNSPNQLHYDKNLPQLYYKPV